MKVKFLSLLVISAALFAACNKDNTKNEDAGVGEITTLVPHLWAQSVTIDGKTTAVVEKAALRGKWTGGVADELGFFFSTNPVNTASFASNTIEGAQKCVFRGSESDGFFIFEVSELEMNVTYYFVAYVQLKTGVYMFGEVKNFKPYNLEFEAAAKPTATAVADSYDKATVAITPGSFGAVNNTSADVLKIYEIGLFYWIDGSGSLETAIKVIKEADRDVLDAIKAGDKVEFELTKLEDATKYNFVPFIQLGLFRPGVDMVVFEPVNGDRKDFTTLSIPPYFSVDNKPVTVDWVANSDAVITVTGNVDWTTTITAGTGASIASGSESGSGEGTVTVDFFENDLESPREVTVTISTTADVEVKSFDVTITQAGKPGSMNPMYVKVTSEPADWSGDYLIVYENANATALPAAIFNGGLDTGTGSGQIDATLNAIVLSLLEPPMSITNGTIEANIITDAARFTIAAVPGGYSIQSASGNYIGTASDANTISASQTFTATNHTNTIALNVDGNAVITPPVATRAMRYNSGDVNRRFCFFAATGQQPVALYKRNQDISTGTSSKAFVRVDAGSAESNWAGTYLIVYEAQVTGGSSTYGGSTVLVFNSNKDGAPYDAAPVADAGNVFALKPDKLNSPILIPHAIPSSYVGTASDLAAITGGNVVIADNAVTVTGGKIKWTQALEDAAVTIAAVEGGGWSILTAGDYYIGAGGNNGNLNANQEIQENQANTITIGSTEAGAVTFNKCAIIVSNGGTGSYMRVNGNTGRFGYWNATNQHPIALYKLQEE